MELFLEVVLNAWISSCIREVALKGSDDWKKALLKDKVGKFLGWMGAVVVLEVWSWECSAALL